MTLDDLLGLQAKDLEKLSDDEIKKFFEPYLNVTRPERVEKEVALYARPSAAINMESAEKKAKIAKAKELARQLGINL